MINIKKGLRLPISGEPRAEIDDGASIRSIAVLGNDYPGMKPTMEVAPGDTVKKGQILFSDKKTDGVIYTAPQAGTITDVHRGAKRALLAVEIECGAGEEITFEKYDSAALAQLDRQVVVDQLINSGVWTALRTRPFARVPDPTTTPNSIFVTAMDTNPLGFDPLLVINDQAAEFSAGLDVLSTLSKTAVHVCHEAGKFLPTGQAGTIVAHEFAGIHPAGLAGTHIHFIDPVNTTKTVWYLNYQDTIAIGHLFLTGQIKTDRVISLAGPGVSDPRLVRVPQGANLTELTAGQLVEGEQRVISGSVLAGHAARGPEAFLGRYDLQVSVIPEDTERRLFGYLAPGANKHSVFPAFLSKWLGEKNVTFTTTSNGSARGMVPIGTYDDVIPMDILATPLMRALLVNDLDNAIGLGCLELAEEDIALCTYACPGKYEFGPVLRDVLDQIQKEG